jgi:hypothetical protein
MLTRDLAVAAAVCALIAQGLGLARGAQPRFLPDDPLTRAPETADASGAQPRDIDLFYDLSYNLFVTARRQPTGTPAQNVNTIDEVPDSSWFTNRIGTRAVTIPELMRGPVAGAAPAPSSWTITREKTAGDAPGFTARDANGETWFVSFDARSNPQGATSAVVVATKIFWAFGYNQVEYFLTRMRPETIQIDSRATRRRPSGERTRMTREDVEEILERAHRSADGSYRAAAGRLLPGKVLGGFTYEGTRPDDPNDLVPHEHRRELRALRVFGAWTNLTDMKAGNTLDTIVMDGSRGVIRHYLQDVGSTFGVGANGPHEWNEGWEYIFDGPAATRRLLTLGFGLSPWQTARYDDYPSIGRFEGDAFDPEAWKPRAPTAAYIEMREDDAFWAARRVMAFSDELIRAAVRTGEYTDASAERHLVDVLIKRRDTLGRVYLTKINPVIDPVLDSQGVLTFGNAAVRYGFASAPRGYTVDWYLFDNRTGESRPLSRTTGPGERIAGPRGLPDLPGAYVRVDVAVDHPDHPRWNEPVQAYFLRRSTDWKLVGFERAPFRARETQRLTDGSRRTRRPAGPAGGTR